MYFLINWREIFSWSWTI